MRVALFGGSFHPPHVGHLLAATYVRAVAPVDEVWLMPAHRHPFGKELAPFEDRVALCEAMAELVDGVKVSRVEAEVEGGGRTIHTVEHLRKRHPGAEFRLVVGADILAESKKWLRFDRLVELCPLIVLARAGHPMPDDRPAELGEALYLPDVQLPEVSSTLVRSLLARGEDASAFVARPVLEELRKRHLYGT